MTRIGLMGIRGLALLVAAWMVGGSASGEVMIQLFNTSWNDMAEKMPELAEAGYGAIWVPPPTKGSGGLSVGYDLWDPFDLGGKDQRSTVKTRYGTQAEFVRMVETAQRFGIRIYIDNIMNHRAFDIPGYNETTPIDLYPGMAPEDFHLRKTEDGFYRKWDNVSDWNDAWQVQNRNFSDLIDIAQESPNANFGATEGSTYTKISFVRHPANPEYYDHHPALGYVGFGNTNITAGLIASNQTYYTEDVGAYLIRAARWLIETTKADGLRLDAVKHVPDYFFGEQSGAGKDESDAGYCGNAQRAFNRIRGYSDANHRDTVFNTEAARDDAMMFGEHLGSPPSFDGYINAGMRLKDAPLRDKLNGILGSPWGTLAGLDSAGGGSVFTSGQAVQFAHSHDSDYSSARELQYAFYMTRAGLPNVYSDGNYQSETLAQSGGAFPRHANTAFLGQFSDGRLPNLAYIHNHFARGDQWGVCGDEDYLAYERIDKRENGSMSNADGAVLLFMMNDNYSAGASRSIASNLRFGHTSFVDDAYLYNYSTYGGGFYVYASQMGSVIVPAGGYFAFSYRTPEESDAWRTIGGKPVEIFQNGERAPTVSYVRKDGPNGDPDFNPYGVANDAPDDYAYTWSLPRVTSPTNLRFVARVDGSAIDVRMKLDGGTDINSGMANGTNTFPLGDTDGSDAVLYRDARPALTTDTFLGYELMQFVQRTVKREKFAAKDSNRNQYGSPGSESYQVLIGTAGGTNFAGTGTNDWSDSESVYFAYHDGADTITASGQPAEKHLNPPPESAAGNSVSVWVKTGDQFDANKLYVYYTTDGQTFPEGAAGLGVGSTKVAEAFWVAADSGDGTKDWWRATLPAMSGGTTLRYKIGVYRKQDGSGNAAWNVPFPENGAKVTEKKAMLGEWETTNFNARTVRYKPHYDYGTTSTGLVEGFHILQGRAYLQRDNRAALFNTFAQSFYLDATSPTGAVIYPAADYDDLGSQEYGGVVRTDPTVADVYVHYDDNNAANDDAATGQSNGNGLGTNGLPAWIAASSVTPSLNVSSPYEDEWRFTYRNIPASGVATILVRLAEISSSTNMALSDTNGWFTTLQRLVDARAPTQAMYVAYPESDGMLINDQDDYQMKIWFSKSLADGISEDTLKDRFLIKINGSAQAKDFTINWNIFGDFHELVFPLPDLFGGDTNYLHTIEVTHDREGVILEAYRYIRSKSEATGPYVAITYPPEVDSDGKAFVIELADVASPTDDQRRVPIKVDTDASAKSVWIEFANNAGIAGLVDSVETAVAGLVDVVAGTNLVVGREVALSGSVSVTISNNLLTGTGTSFSNQVMVGSTLRIDTNSVVVTQVVSQTSLRFADPYPGPSVTNVGGVLLPRFDVDFQTGDTVRLDSNLLSVSQILNSTNLVLSAAYPGATASGLTAYRVDGNPVWTGSRLQWTFSWSNMTAGTFTYYARVDTNNVTNTVEASAQRTTTVVLRERVDADANDYDDDDDGLYDYNEQTATNYPAVNSEQWVNSDVHIVYIYGKSDPQSPDSDGDGLPDGLESGWRNPIDISQTLTNTDTDGDGFKNFLADLDPPFFNTLDNYGKVPTVNSQSEGGDRAKLVRGTLTDPANSDSDYDGIKDGVEDANRNGWVDGDGEGIPPSWDPWLARAWPNNSIDVGETWVETSPTANDSDGDGLSDGYGEDKNFNGWVDGDANSNRVWNAGELWTETDPLNDDTDGDGLLDGWEVQYGLDPWDSGTVGATNLKTGGIIANTDNGPAGNPDGDVVCNTTDPYYNLLEYQNGDNPKWYDSCAPLPEGSIIIGRGTNVLGNINGTDYYGEFTDWTWDDLIVLDEYEGDGGNNQGGDIYPAWDGFDTSRDLVAFYARDGGPETGDFYFRVDLHDLQPLAEEGYLDLYVAISFGTAGSQDPGEMAFPDDVDLVTSSRWEVVVACYQSGLGAVYVDLDANNNSTVQDDGSNLTAFGVERRDQSHTAGFKASYYNSELDAVEFSIKRQALLDAGWNGNSDDLRYQVISTKDGTCNSCGEASAPGAGDIGGRNDVRDTIYDDHVAEDYWQAQGQIQNALVYYFDRATFAGRAKVSFVAHANQAIEPGRVVQNLINNGVGAGYHRLLDIHDIYDQPVNLHITPTLASAIEWAKADPALGTPWRDGPAFNDRIAALAATNVVSLLGSTFSDHLLPYFSPDFNRDNDALAREFLETIYGVDIHSNSVFWPPERVLDADVFGKIADLGYNATVVDQDTHLFYWLGRTESLSTGGYQVNRINGTKAFVLNNAASNYRFENDDSGLNMSLRGLYSRRARSSTQDQVITLLSNWEDFGTGANADAYDKNLRWIANHPWIKVVSLEDILQNQVDLGYSGDWTVAERGNAATNKLSHNYIQHAARGDVDNWYVGKAGEEQGLQTNKFNIRTGVPMPTAFGMLYFPGVATQAWYEVVNLADTNLAKLARGALHASMFQTAFHDEDNNNLERFSIGTYVSSDSTYDALASFARNAQGQTRKAAAFDGVDDWASFAGSVTTPQAQAADVDLDGEDEYILYNDRLYAQFERIGGRMVGAWVRNILDGRVYQVVGNPLAAAGTETEEEGTYNVETNGAVNAYRTSGLKDWYAAGENSGYQGVYNNLLYTFTNWTNGWRMVAENGAITKTVTLDAKANSFRVQYSTAAPVAGSPLYIRHGLSLNLYDLLLNGQATLGSEEDAGGVVSLANTNYATTVEARIGYADAGNSAGFNPVARDDDFSKGVTNYTLRMRNQAQTHQVEMVGTNSFAFAMTFRAYPSDWDADGIPNTVEDQHGFLNAGNGGDGAADEDDDRVSNVDEYIANTDMNSGSDYPRAAAVAATNASGIVVRFPTKTQREYRVWYANGGLVAPAWAQATTGAITGTGGTVDWIDTGATTAPAPVQSTNRFYQIRVGLPQ